jgi:hypothetical protein
MGCSASSGYRVGSTNGKDSDERQRTSAAIFGGHCLPFFPRPYMAEWSRPGASERLRKMAETLCRLGKEREVAR